MGTDQESGVEVKTSLTPMLRTKANSLAEALFRVTLDGARLREEWLRLYIRPCPEGMPQDQYEFLIRNFVVLESLPST